MGTGNPKAPEEGPVGLQEPTPSPWRTSSSWMIISAAGKFPRTMKWVDLNEGDLQGPNGRGGFAETSKDLTTPSVYQSMRALIRCLEALKGSRQGGMPGLLTTVENQGSYGYLAAAAQEEAERETPLQG